MSATIPAAAGGRLAALLAPASAFAVVAGGIFGGLDNSFGDPITCVANALLVALTVIVTRPSMRTWRSSAAIFAPLAIAAAWGGAISLGSFGAPALVPDLALPELLGLVATGGILLVGYLIVRSRPLHIVVAYLVAMATSIALLGLGAHATGTTLSDTLWQSGQQGRFAGTFGNANVAATFYAATAALALGLMMRSRSGPRRNIEVLLSGMAAAVLLTACLLTASRTAALGLAAATAALLFVLMKRKRATRHALVFGAVAAVIAALVLMLASDFLVVRSAAIDQDWQLRREIWNYYAALAMQSPWLGHGLGSFQAVNLANLDSAETATRLWTINAAHNAVLQMVIEGGLPFALLVTGSFAVALGSGVAAIDRDRPDPVAAAVGLAIGILVLNGMVDIALNVPTTTLLCWFLLGLLWGEGGRIRLSRRSSAMRATAG